jgi:hypothetical protein
MNAFLLETLLSKGWRRGGEVFWTPEDATSAGQDLIRRKLARRVRILPIEVGLEPTSELSSTSSNFKEVRP